VGSLPADRPESEQDPIEDAPHPGFGSRGSGRWRMGQGAGPPPAGADGDHRV